MPRAGKKACPSRRGSRPPGRRAIWSSLHPVRFELQVLHFAAEHDDGAVTPVVPGIGELEGVGAGDLQLPFLVARQAQLGERYRVVEELQEGQLKIARTYTFEFSDTGNNRRHGAIV